MIETREYQREWLVLGIAPGRAAALLRIAWPTGWELDLVRALLVELTPLRGRWSPYDVGPLASQADLVVLERHHGSQSVDGGSAFTRGRTYGQMEGALAMATLAEVIAPTPVHWREAFDLGDGEEGEAKGLKMARELLDMPDGRLNSHKDAHAIMLAWWGWRMVLLPRLNGLAAASEMEPEKPHDW